jgi:hypothetical protein
MQERHAHKKKTHYKKHKCENTDKCLMPMLTAHETRIRPQRFKMEFTAGLKRGEYYTRDACMTERLLDEKLQAY